MRPPAPSRVVALLLAGASSAWAAELVADFGADPFLATDGAWRVVGDPGLFRWDAAAGRLAVTWDSSRPDSFCVLPLGQTVTASQAVTFSWDLTLDVAGPRPGTGRTNVLQVGVGLVRQSRLPDGYPLRTSGGRAQDLLDFSFFPLADYGPFGTSAYVSPVAFGTRHAGYSFGNPLDLADGASHRIECRWDPSTRRLRTSIPDLGPVEPTDPPLPPDDDFAVDALAILVWNESPTPRDSLLAQGSIDNVRVILPDPPGPPLGRLAYDAGARAVRFQSRVGYRYQLEGSGDLALWASLNLPVDGTGGELVLADYRKALFPQQFYRVRATPMP